LLLHEVSLDLLVAKHPNKPSELGHVPARHPDNHVERPVDLGPGPLDPKIKRDNRCSPTLIFFQGRLQPQTTSQRVCDHH
jgi:hypothetical protein